MTTDILTRPVEATTVGKVDIEHGCCDAHPAIAWCGADVTGEVIEDGYLEDADNPCVVCMDLEVCAICGRDLAEGEQ